MNIKHEILKKQLKFLGKASITPSLTIVKVKNGYEPSNYADCSRFIFGNPNTLCKSSVRS